MAASAERGNRQSTVNIAVPLGSEKSEKSILSE